MEIKVRIMIFFLVLSQHTMSLY